jgi:hypothetical protein
MSLPPGVRVFMLSDWLTLPAILNLRATCQQMKKEQDDAYATGKFESFGFDAYRYRSVEEVEGMMNTRILLRSFHFELEGLRKRWNPLHKMCKDNKPAIAQLLITTGGLGINTVDNIEYTPLHGAAICGHMEVVRVLLVHADIAVNQAADKGATPLYNAANYDRVEVVMALLVHDGIAANRAKNSGATPLYVAAWEGHVEVVVALLALPGKAINQADNDGRTPLSIAVQKGRVEVVHLLQERHAL